MMDLTELQDRCINDSRYWFPDVHTTNRSALVHFALGLAGEVGELVNLIKKANRDADFGGQIGHRRTEIAHECADVLIYLCDLAHEAGIDLAEAVEQKRAILIERWGNPDTGRRPS